uniref:Uncharacterized protein n=1 Tax=Caenorhabditis japonica TaxID=281687 RepID=A0A8R1E794_CAEJA
MEGGYCTTNFDCQPNLYCTASVNGVKICLSSNNGGGGSGYPSGNGGCQTSSNCQYGSVCVVTNGVGSCQIQTGGYVSPARQDFNDDAFSKNIPEPGKLNSGCERDGDCDPELSCTLYFGEMMCRFPVKPLIPLRCETDAECPSTEYLCVFSTAMQDKICYKYGDVVTDGYVIPIKHKISMELKKSTTTTESPLTSSVEPIGTFAESEAIFEPESAGIMPQPFLSSALQKRADDVEHRAPARNKSQAPFSPVYMKMMDAAYSEELAHQHDGETAKVTKFVVNEEKERKKDVEDRKEEEEEGIANWEPIDPMATVCEFDYHCRMGESCSGRIRFVDRNVTVCRYDMLKKHRQCIYHSDCLSGQVFKKD